MTEMGNHGINFGGWNKNYPMTSNKKMGSYIAIGIGIGTAFGVAMGNLGLGISLGIAIGIAIGYSRRTIQFCQKKIQKLFLKKMSYLA